MEYDLTSYNVAHVGIGKLPIDDSQDSLGSIHLKRSRGPCKSTA